MAAIRPFCLASLLWGGCVLESREFGVVGQVTAGLRRPLAFGSSPFEARLWKFAFRRLLLRGSPLEVRPSEGIDVASVEPIEASNPLLHANNCFITPHYAWATLEARRRLMQTTVDNVRAFIDGQPVHVVN